MHFTFLFVWQDGPLIAEKLESLREELESLKEERDHLRDKLGGVDEDYQLLALQNKTVSVLIAMFDGIFWSFSLYIFLILKFSWLFISLFTCFLHKFRFTFVHFSLFSLSAFYFIIIIFRSLVSSIGSNFKSERKKCHLQLTFHDVHFVY